MSKMTITPQGLRARRLWSTTVDGFEKSTFLFGPTAVVPYEAATEALAILVEEALANMGEGAALRLLADHPAACYLLDSRMVDLANSTNLWHTSLRTKDGVTIVRADDRAF